MCGSYEKDKIKELIVKILKWTKHPLSQTDIRITIHNFSGINGINLTKGKFNCLSSGLITSCLTTLRNEGKVKYLKILSKGFWYI